MSQKYHLDPEFADQMVDQKVIQRNLLWVPKLLKYFADSSNKSFVVVVGAAHFPSNQGILKLLADKGIIFTSFDNTLQSSMSPSLIKAKTPTNILEKKIAIAEDEKIKIHNQAMALVDFVLRADPPKVNIDGREQNPIVIKLELINTMIRILKTNPGLGRIKYRIFLNNYIRTRNEIFSDHGIIDKNKVLGRLQANPALTMEQLK